MKLLLVLLFMLPLSVSVQAKSYKHSQHKKTCKKSLFCSIRHAGQHYITAGGVFDYANVKEEGSKAAAIYSLEIGRGIILDKKYDYSLNLKYAKSTDKTYGLNLATKYLFKSINWISKKRKRGAARSSIKEGVIARPYIGAGVSFDKANTKNSSYTDKQVNFSTGIRVPVLKNIMLTLDFTYSIGNRSNSTTDDIFKITNRAVTMNWGYFF